MCELFAMSSLYPATVRMSLEEFSRHGGLSGPHKDGWGIAWYDDRDVRLLKEAYPAATSACARFVQQHPFRSSCVISHIRKATQGAVATRNCQPFIRELGGTWHTFAHNGNLGGIVQAMGPGSATYRPVGETDSEQAFCLLMDRIRPLWAGSAPPDLSSRIEVVTAFAEQVRALGPANFLYSDGDALFVHAHRRHHADGTIRAPGVWRLERHCIEGGDLDADGLRIEAHAGEQRVQLLASVPLSDEGWTPLAEGSVHVIRAGQLVRSSPI